MDEYDQKIDAIEKRVARTKILRDAQIEGSARWHHFQQQIDELTSALISWETNAVEMRALDQRALEATEAAEQAELYVQYAARTWNQTAAGAGGFGALLIFASLVITVPWWVIAGGILALLLAGGCVYGGIRAHQDAVADRDSHTADVAAADTARARLLPGGR